MGIQFASYLWQKLNYFRKTFFKTSHKSFALGLLNLLMIIVSVCGLSARNATWTKEARLILQSEAGIYILLPIFRKTRPSLFRVLNTMLMKQYLNNCLIKKKTKYWSLMITLSTFAPRKGKYSQNHINTNTYGDMEKVRINVVSILSLSYYLSEK